MKRLRWLSMILILFVAVFLTACTPEGEIDFDELFETAQAEIDLAGTVTTNVTLPATVMVDDIEVAVSWESSHPNVISIAGIVNRPTHDVGNVTVTLTATFTYLEQTHTHPFTVVVEALPIDTFVVNFYSKGVVYQTVTVDDGSLVTQPVNPTPGAYETFGGWYKEDTFVTVWNFSVDTISAATNIYAKWNAVPQHTVTLNPDNGLELSTMLVYEGDKIGEITPPTKAGYTFVAWVKEDETPWVFDTDTVTSPITLYATYELITYTITRVIPGDATLVDSGQLTYNVITPINDLGSVSKEYADFVGWFDAAEGGNQVTGYPVGTTGNITLYARFEDHVPFVVTFSDSKGVDVTQNRYLGQYALPIEDPIHQGYTFMGWFIDLEDEEPFNFATMINADVMLYAKYDLITYAINYHVDGGIHENPMSYTVETPTITLLDAAKDHFTFIGWFTSDVGGTEVMSIALGSTGHLVLYARYEAVTYTITYELNEGILLENNPSSYTILTPTIVLNEPTKEGYLFVGWFTLDVGGNQVESITLGSTGNLELYARFSELINVNYYANMDVQIEDMKSSSTWPESYLILTKDSQVLTQGEGSYGLLGHGSFDSSDVWINITPFFNLEEGELIVSIYLQDMQALAHTSLGRLFVWGFLSDDGIETYLNLPMDVSTYSEFAEDEILEVMPLGHLFMFTTSEGLFIFNQAVVTDITPELAPGEEIIWAYLFGFGDISSPLAFSTASSIYLFDPYETFGFVNITADLNLVEEDVIAVLSQDLAVHILTETRYYYATFTGDEQMPFMVMDIPLSISMLENEFVLELFGGALFTSEHRLLIPYYVYGESEEMPEEIIYVDVTDDIGLAEGEMIVKVHDPFFIETSLGRVLLVMLDENEITDLEDIILPEVIDIGLEGLLLEGELFEGFLFMNWQLYFKSNLRLASVGFGQNGLVLNDIVVQILGLIHREQLALHLIEENLYTPDVPLYQQFVGWYVDEDLKTPFEGMLAFDEMNLYAKFEYTHYFITFEFYGEGYLPMMVVEMDDIPEEPTAPEREHFEFYTWYYFDDEGYQTYDFTYALNQDVMLFASYVSVQYEVTFAYEDFDDIVMSHDAQTYYGDLEMIAPEGYEVIGIYMDEDMLIPYDPEMQLLGPVTFYLALDPLTIEIYYFNDMESIHFEALYSESNQTYGVTTDGKIFAWGYNYNGSLGIGFSEIQDISVPYDMTSVFNFNPGETVLDLVFNYNSKLLLTTEGRLFAWGFYDNTGSYQSTPQEMTHYLNLSLGQHIVHMFPESFGAYIFLNDGTIMYLNYSNYEAFHKSSSLNFEKIAYRQQLYFASNQILVITDFVIAQITLNPDSTVADVVDLTSIISGDEIFGVKMNFQAYQEYFIYTKEGRIYLINLENLNVSLVVDLNLNSTEVLMDSFIVSWDTMAFSTSEGRLIGYDGTNVFTYDVSILNIGEKLLSFEYGYQFFTSEGRSVILDMTDKELYSVEDVYMLSEDVIKYHMINWVLLAETVDHRFYQVGGMEFDMMVGKDLSIEQYQYGQAFVLAEPMEKMGYAFDGWVDMYGNLYTDTPTHAIILYAVWLPIE